MVFYGNSKKKNYIVGFLQVAVSLWLYLWSTAVCLVDPPSRGDVKSVFNTQTI